MSGDQRQTGVYGVADPGEGGGAQDNAQHDRHDAESPVPAVAHDRQPLLPIMAADQPVGRVGEAVLVQCSGQDNTAEHRQDGRRPIAEPEQPDEEKSQCRHPADPGADQRKGPGGGGEPLGVAWRWGNRDPSEKGSRHSKLGKYPASGHAVTIA